MNHQYYNVLGVMSGTSLDGVDIARISLVRKDSWIFQIHEAVSIPYPENILEKLKKAIKFSPAKLDVFDLEYTQYLGAIINDFMERNKINNLDAICSHGHTIHHRPHEGYTCQIGNRKELATIANNKVICDFRAADVALGGQGAPLVPIGDQLLFSDYDYCLNLGGFANVSYKLDGHRVAFDICPLNVVLNEYALKLGREYDEGGAFAKAGTVNNTVLNKLNELDYYSTTAPKSLGVEWVAQKIKPILSKIGDPKDAIATFMEHSAQQIAANLKDHKKVLSTGGGTFNSYLMERIRFNSQATINIPEPKHIEFKEALIFGFLGVLKMRNENNCLASVTGAKRDHSSGVVFAP